MRYPDTEDSFVPKQFQSGNIVERFVVENDKPFVPKRLRQLLFVQRTADKQHKTKESAAN